MKGSFRFIVVCALAAGIHVALPARARAGAFVDFNTGGTDSFNANFIHHAISAGNSDAFVYGPLLGIGDQAGGANGGGLKVAPTSPGPDATAIYAPGGSVATTFNINDGQLHAISMFVREGAGNLTGSANKQLQIGFLANGTSFFNGGSSFISARLLSGNQVEFQSNNGSSTQAALNTGAIAGINADDWLQLIFTIKQTSPGTYAGSFSLLDFGATGVGTPVTLLAPVSYAGQPAAAGLTSLELSGLTAGFRMAEDSGTDATATLSYDNFAVDAPEPASAALLAIIGSGLLLRRRLCISLE